MRGLAEFVMRGRWQALAVAVLGSGSLLFGWISAAAVALVTLRQGPKSGGWLVFWALLPVSLVTWVTGDAGGLLLLCGVYGLAVVLRESRSLALAVVVTVPLGLCCGAFLIAVTGDFLNALVTWFEQVFAEMNRGFVERGATDVRLVPPNATQVAGLLAAGNAALCAVSLMLARYWQALLFNPGGFGAEFRQLRLPTRWTLVLAALLLGITAASGEMGGWAVVFAVPLTLCGFALIHSWVRARGAGKPALVASYFFWVVFAPIKGVLMALVVIDSFIDFRSRWTAKEDSSI